MCRNIRTLFNYDPPSTSADIEAAALQYVRKVSGYRFPSAANEGAFQQAVADIANATASLLASLETSAPPRDRGAEIAKARARNAKRFGAA
ncbi:MAG: DUF2277 domain-containing protein [Chloroflexota bacterium]|nr:DUF2277 domain-containing protein [Chloroflexota bacterium]MDE2909551.1 DUF2277 domain-containing protein [Chloroflexota bacterium]